MHDSDLPASGPLRAAGGSGDGGDGSDYAGGVQRAVSGDGGRVVRPGGAWGDGDVQKAGEQDEAAGTLSGGRLDTPGGRGADGGAFGVPGGGQRARGPRFDSAVPARGYEWWYVDALSDDGAHGITIIAFVGSVFSPWYAWARRGGRQADPADFCAMNVALYGKGKRRWAMTERGRNAVSRSADHFRVGPSQMEWDGECLTVRIEERCAPLPLRLRGTVKLHPAALPEREVLLDGRDHRWSPIAPVSRVEVAFSEPGLSWSGAAYFDTNAGASPLEEAFVGWDWSRAPGPSGTSVLYNGLLKSGEEFCAALRYRPDGSVEDFDAPPRVDLARTLWGLARRTRVDEGETARVRETLTDAPFYARSVIETTLHGERLQAMHESLDMRRFVSPWVQAMLPFKAPRAFR